MTVSVLTGFNAIKEVVMLQGSWVAEMVSEKDIAQ
jgi:hypothetical protein